jgi:hypothetical protein
MVASIYHPQSGGNFKPDLKPNQRYRNTFGDKRLELVYQEFSNALVQNQTSVIKNLSKDINEVVSYYRFLQNAYFGETIPPISV